MGIQPGAQGSTRLSDGSEAQMPLLTYRASTFSAFFTISAAKAQALLPGDELRAVRLTPGRSLLVVQAMQYIDKSIDPYLEFACSIPVERSRHAAVPGLSLAKFLLRPGAATYITHLGVDTDEARLIGLEILGLPKFVAEIELTETATERIAEVTLDGESLFTLAVTRSESHKQRFEEFSLYTLSPIENKLFHIPYQAEASIGVSRGSRAARLHLGSHAVADEIRDLAISPAPLLSADIPEYSLISNRPDETIEVGDWRDPRAFYRDLRSARRPVAARR